MTASSIRERTESKIAGLFYQNFSSYELKCLVDMGLFPLDTSSQLVKDVFDDLLSFADKDPATGGRTDILLDNSTSFLAGMYYRISNYLWRASEFHEGMEHLAIKISEIGKRITGIDIHHAANIGKRLVLDHAYGTVIGETCCIGDDCYILGGVILGAYGISGNESEKRHPTIGDRVQIGSSARVLGPIEVGSDVFISPHCVVTKNIPNGTQVSIINQIQVNKFEVPLPEPQAKVFGSLVSQGEVILLCKGFVRLTANVVDRDLNVIPEIKIKPFTTHENIVVLKVEVTGGIDCYKFSGPLHLQVRDQESDITLINPPHFSQMLFAITYEPSRHANESI